MTYILLEPTVNLKTFKNFGLGIRNGNQTYNFNFRNTLKNTNEMCGIKVNCESYNNFPICKKKIKL